MRGIKNAVVSEEKSEVWKRGSTLVHGLNWVLAPEDLERVRLGYLCIECMEPHEVAMPEKCSVCEYPMRDDQTRRYAREFQGEVPLGASTTDSEELDRLDEEHNRRFHKAS